MGKTPLFAAVRPPLGASAFHGAERRDTTSRGLLVRRVRSEFDEMPGLRLTFAQARLLFDLEAGCCQRVLGFLAESGYLVRTRDGRFGRRDSVG